MGVNVSALVAGLEGRVVRIDLRYTILEGQDGRQFLLPNSMLFTNPVVILRKRSAMPKEPPFSASAA
ncbi:MAG: mechanosensitive ion channel [Candidatus Omnitrophica bacterium]|nr:mechanosensitive ion channel [Candidatus Omnitrophota bacterium]